jgi:hypothetical protein
MTGRNRENENGPKPMNRWKGVILPTVIIVGIAIAGAAPIQVTRDAWQTVARAEVSLDDKQYHTFDNTTGWVATLGLEPSFFVDYNQPGGTLKWVPMANGGSKINFEAGLPKIDRRKQSVRYVLILKNNSQVPIDEKNGHTVTGNMSADGKTGFSFKALTVPREGVRTGFHPGDVKEIRLQVRNRRDVG